MTTALAALVGPTASGKSALAMAVARRGPDVELVSLDAMQVYRGLDLGTAKPTPEERAEVPHHLLDLVEPDEEMSVARFRDEYLRVGSDLAARGARGLLVGGTGLYLRAIVDELEIPARYPEIRAALDAEPDTVVLHRRLCGLDPLAASRMEPSNRRRVLRALEVTVGSGRPFSSFGPGLEVYPPPPFPLVGLRMSRAALDRRIEDRFRMLMDAGFLDEVRRLAARPHGCSRTARQALGYRELLAHVEQGTSLDAAVEEAIRRTRRLARRQERWFRRDPRIRWIDGGEEPKEMLARFDEAVGREHSGRSG